jgi:hypothetical protein
VNAELDHLVIAARTLDEGVAWCEATLGVTPGPGGRHALMGTHNRLLSIASSVTPRAYVEIIAIDTEAAVPGRPRWFDLDTAEVRALLSHGPQLIHWVLRCDDIDERCKRLRDAGVDRGEVIGAQRQTPQGLLQWRISVRPDGARLFDGAMPTFIQWGAAHPADTMPASGVQLDRLQVAGLPLSLTPECAASGVVFVAQDTPLCAHLSTSRGAVSLRSIPLRDSHVHS